MKNIVISTECLNQKSEWNLDYFNRLRLALSIQKNEFKYTFSDIKEEPSNKIVYFKFRVKFIFSSVQNFGSDQKREIQCRGENFKFLAEKINLFSFSQIVLLILKVHASSQSGIISNLFNFLININKRKNVLCLINLAPLTLNYSQIQVKELEMKMEKEKKEKTELLAEMEKLSTSKNTFENEVFEKVHIIYYFT